MSVPRCEVRNCRIQLAGGKGMEQKCEEQIKHKKEERKKVKNRRKIYQERQCSIM
jgi:hypothetical protein